MRNIGIILAAVSAIGLSLPMITAAKAEEARIVINSGDHDRDWNRRHHHKKVVVIKEKHHYHD